jgi:hypothetical protein
VISADFILDNGWHTRERGILQPHLWLINVSPSPLDETRGKDMIQEITKLLGHVLDSQQSFNSQLRKHHVHTEKGLDNANPFIPTLEKPDHELGGKEDDGRDGGERDSIGRNEVRKVEAETETEEEAEGRGREG